MRTVITYVIELTGHGLIKIGKTTDMMARLRGIQESNPYEIRLVARLRGDVVSQLQSVLADKCVRDSWFRYDDKAKEIINLLDQYQPGEIAQ